MPDSWGSLRRRMASRADGAWYSLSGGGSPDGTLGPMKPYGTNIVTFRVLLAGYEQAVNRFGQVSRSRDPLQVFAPLFEALNWAVALDDEAREHYAPEGEPLDWGWRSRVSGGEFVSAVRCARNRVHHQWADALTLSEGFSAPLVAPIVAHEWRWRCLADLPQSDPVKGRAPAKVLEAESAYERLLAGHPGRVVLGELRAPFRQLADLLEPPRPGRDS